MATIFRLLVAPSSFTYTPFRVITPLPPLHGLDPMAHFTLGWITSPKPAQILFLLRPFIISIRQPQGQNMLTQMLEFKINEVSRLPRYYTNVYNVVLYLYKDTQLSIVFRSFQILASSLIINSRKFIQSKSKSYERPTGFFNLSSKPFCPF